VLDNDTVQVTLLTSAPGEASQPNANPEAELGIVLQGGLTLTIPNGRGVLGPGAVTFLASLIPHEARNEASLPGKMRALTFKKSTEGTGR
jgi:quercetin dioxygenase-like cupin family protein